eukprot:364599-Chlamydomonas_euryale.AAC.15
MSAHHALKLPDTGCAPLGRKSKSERSPPSDSCSPAIRCMAHTHVGSALMLGLQRRPFKQKQWLSHRCHGRVMRSASCTCSSKSKWVQLTRAGAPPFAFNSSGAADKVEKAKAPSFLTNSAATEPTGGSKGFTFGGAQKAPESFGAPAQASIFGKSPFGSAAGASKEKPALNFGGPCDKPAAGAFSFGKSPAGGDDGGSGEQPVAKKVAFSFGGSGEGTDQATSAKPFSFGGSASGAAASGGAFSFGSAAKGEAGGTKASTSAPFTFGSAAAPTAAGSAPFSFGGVPPPASSGASGGLFSFGAAPGPGTTDAGAGAAGGEDEGEEDAPNKFESETCTYTSR